MTKFYIKYKGKEYFRAEDLARAYGVKTELVRDRYHSGFRDPKALISRNKLVHSYTAPHVLNYKGIQYDSLKSFVQEFGLNYTTALACWKRGIKDPADLIDYCQYKGQIKTLRSNSINDQFMIEKFLNEHDLLSSRQLSRKTGLSVDTIATQLSNIVQDHSRSGIGLQKEDIAKVKLTQAEYNLLASNARLLPKYAFRKSAAKHILEHKREQKNQHLKVFPYFKGKYYVDMSSGEVWSKNHGKDTFRRIKKLSGCYTFRDANGKRYSFLEKDVLDITNQPEITAEDLISRKELFKKLGFTKSLWDNRKLYSLLPSSKMHVRLNDNGKKIIGWLRSSITKTINRYPEKFKSNQRNLEKRR